MDLYQLRYFLEVARERSFTRAARNLHVSPPAVSKSVALLERSLKRRLLTRTRRHVELTVDGERMRRRVEEIYDIIEGLRLEFEGLASGDPAMLKIGSREMITNYLLTPSLRAFRRTHPATRFGVYELSPRQMADALRKDLIDFAFYYKAEVTDPAVEVRKLGALTSHIYAAPRCGAGALGRATSSRSAACRSSRRATSRPTRRSPAPTASPTRRIRATSATRPSCSRPTAATPSKAWRPPSCPTSSCERSGAPAGSRACRVLRLGARFGSSSGARGPCPRPSRSSSRSWRAPSASWHNPSHAPG